MIKRKALSTVIGAVFAIIALTTTVTYISYSMGILDNYNQSVLTKNQQLSDINTEKFQISSVTVPNNHKLNITVANTGNLPIKFTKIWVQNTTTAATSTSWVNSYVPTNNFVVPGGTLTNIGQLVPVSINSANSYNIKLVTSRGNTQQFNVASVAAAPLKIQLLAVPSSIVTGFNSSLIMIVTNNGSSILTNVTPNLLPASTGAASCIPNSVSPPSYASLSPGNIAIFKWDVKATGGGSSAQSCTFTLSQPLQNGYSQTLTATINVSPIAFTSTNLAAETGVLTINYTSFRWAQGSGWNVGWDIPGSPGQPLVTAISMNLTNNNSTMDYWIEGHTQLYFMRTSSGNVQRLYIENSTDQNGHTGVSFSCPVVSGYYYCLKIPAGKTVTIYFGAQTINSNNMQNLGAADTYMMQLLLYGKFAPTKSTSGTPYAQDIPFYALLVT